VARFEAMVDPSITDPAERAARAAELRHNHHRQLGLQSQAVALMKPSRRAGQKHEGETTNGER
jgi:hypothetical protein